METIVTCVSFSRLDKNELRTLVVSLLDKQFHKEQVDYLLEEAANCTNNGTLDFTLEVLQNCTKLLAKVEKHYKNRLLNKYVSVAACFWMNSFL